MKAGDLLTIAEVETALNIKGPRVHQLLAAGRLKEIDRPPGRQRHPAGASRVKAESVLELLEERRATQQEQSAVRGARARRPTDAVTLATVAGTPSVDKVNRSPRGARDAVDAEVAAARAAVQELKVRLDVARNEVRRQRVRTDRLIEIASGLLELLKDASSSADQMDEVTDGYSQALTQLVSPDGPASD